MKKALAILYCISLLSLTALGQDKKPNLVLFLADDCTYRDLGTYGSPNSLTPTLDKMASEGMKFNKCYQAAPMCSPTRHNLFNGVYPVRSGAYPNHTFSNQEIKSLPHYLKPLGYRVAFLGKRHIGPSENYPFEFLDTSSKFIDINNIKPFLEEVKTSKEPFCLIICSHQPHGPWNVGDPSLFPPKSLKLKKNMADTEVTREMYSKYLAEVNYMDAQVDSLSQYLDKYNFTDNSLFVFLGEQGNSFPLSKWTCYEDGVHSSFIAKWPGVIQEGVETDALVDYNDIVPTFITAAGGTPSKELDGHNIIPIFKDPSNKGKKYSFSVQTTRGVIQGSDYYGVRAVTDGHYRCILNTSPERAFQNGVIGGKIWRSWLEKAETDKHAAKLVHKYQYRPKVELYDVDDDPDNLKDLADDPKYKKIKEKLLQELYQWMEYCGDEGVYTELMAYQHMNAHKSKVEPTFIKDFLEGEDKTDLQVGAIMNYNGENKFVGKVQVPKPIKSQKGKVSFSGYLSVDNDGYHTFYRKGNIKSEVIIDDKVILTEDHKMKYGVVGLKKGFHKITIHSNTSADLNNILWSGFEKKGKTLPVGQFIFANGPRTFIQNYSRDTESLGTKKHQKELKLIQKNTKDEFQEWSLIPIEKDLYYLDIVGNKKLNEKCRLKSKANGKDVFLTETKNIQKLVQWEIIEKEGYFYIENVAERSNNRNCRLAINKRGEICLVSSIKNNDLAKWKILRVETEKSK
ncbi:sulfatase family protein [Flammeovirga aprica]|uniref:Sulfatase n=1 Tax=Flammeovirga aprica JL-4 TaxID=694437 RepID=A0A7X9RVX3_9BACT|nr:sulfatase [Flammeovirga aprica]NME69676.1 sulfatase [Flammeovirga aprica JL-4]